MKYFEYWQLALDGVFVAALFLQLRWMKLVHKRLNHNSDHISRQYKHLQDLATLMAEHGAEVHDG